MKRFAFIATLVAVVGAASVTYAFSKNSDTKGLTDLQIASIEVLSTDDDPGTGDGTCYEDIHKKDGSKVLYCGTCTYIPGTYDTFSGTGKCPNR